MLLPETVPDGVTIVAEMVPVLPPPANTVNEVLVDVVVPTVTEPECGAPDANPGVG